MPRNPLRGVLLHNSTDKHIMQGPVTVFEGSTYAGDAQIGNTPPGQDRLISYAIDLDILVEPKTNPQESSLQTATIANGILKVTQKTSFTLNYGIQNKSDTDRTLVIECPLNRGGGWKLASPQPFETTETGCRFKKVIPQGKTETYPVVEENVRAESIAILNKDSAGLEVYSRSAEIPPKVREALNKVIELKRSVSESESLIKQKREALQEIDKEQDRIRSNMGTVNASTQYYSRLVEKLNGQETTIETLHAEIGELEKNLQTRKQELENFLANLSI
jgi:Mg2+ and Co2+ transporter CorA